MNTDELALFHGDDLELKNVLVAFVRKFHRLPSGSDLEHARVTQAAAATS